MDAVSMCTADDGGRACRCLCLDIVALSSAIIHARVRVRVRHRGVISCRRVGIFLSLARRTEAGSAGPTSSHGDLLRLPWSTASKLTCFALSWSRMWVVFH